MTDASTTSTPHPNVILGDWQGDQGRARPGLHVGAGPDRPAPRPGRPRVEDERILVDHGLTPTGTNRARPGLREALAAHRAGDTLVVTKPDRLACSLSDARDIADELTAKDVALNLDGSIHDPTDPVGRLLFNVLEMVAESGSDLIKVRRREGHAPARQAVREPRHRRR